MKRLTIFLLMLFSCFLLVAGKSDDKKQEFTSNWKIYKVPIEVKSAAILDFGYENVVNFAYTQRASNKWIYAYESSLDRDPETGKFTLEKKTGEDRFIRFFNDNEADIIINWFPIKDDNKEMKKFFEDWQKSLFEVYTNNNLQLDWVGEVKEDKIGGYSALGAEYKIDQGRNGYFTSWLVYAEDINRWFMIRFSYGKGFTEPSRTFEKVKKEIVFLKP